MLRRLGCTLPIECWYLGPGEYDGAWAELVRPLGITCIDAHLVRDSHPDSWLQGHRLLADENQAVTARLESGPQGTWYGRWVDYERMLVLLYGCENPCCRRRDGRGRHST